MALSQMTCRLNVACDSSMRKRRLARAFGDEGLRDGASPQAWGPSMRSQPTCGCSEERALPAITLCDSYRVDWTVIIATSQRPSRRPLREMTDPVRKSR